MAVPSTLADLSATAASNSPAGSDTVGTTMDDFLRAHASIIARIAAGTDKLAPAAITGTAAILGANTFTGLQTANLGLTVAGADFTSRGITDSATAKALTLSGSGANSVTIANSATNPTIGTSAGGLDLSPVTGFVTIKKSGSIAGLVIDAATGTNGLVAFYVNATEVARIASTASDSLTFLTGSSAESQVRITHTASADRYITLTGANGTNPKIGVSDGQLTLGTGSALATNATVGHLCIPTCAGAPTGVPTNAGAGNLPMIYDTTNNFLYFYNGGWKKSTVYA